jgi:hypothetical protein
MELEWILKGLGFQKTSEDEKYEYWHYRLSPKGVSVVVSKSDLENFQPRENGILNTIANHIYSIGKADERARIRKLL